MIATITAPRAVAAPPSGRSRARLARLERPLLLSGLVLVTLHLLDLTFSGPDTAILGVLGIAAAPTAWALAHRHVTRATRLVLGIVIGLLTFGFAVVSHGLHVVNSGPDWTDVTGVGMIAGGLLLVAAGVTALATPRRAPRRPALGWRLAHGAGWLEIHVRGVSGMRESPSLAGIMPRIAPRPVLLIAGGGDPNEIPANRSYRDAGGSTVQLWELPDTGHTAGLRTHPSEYERRTTTFLDRALGLTETP